MAQLTQTILLQGGLNLVTPAIAVPAGQVIAGENYESEVRGYRRMPGYERLDGRGKPSDASYWILNFDAGVAAIAEGDTVTGATSGATGKALVDAIVSTGSYGGSDAAGYLVLTDVSGTFQDNENLQVSAATKSVADGLAVEDGASTDELDATYTQDAIATRRALITTVPGSGDVRGVWTYKGDVYAVRDDAGATAAVLHKATTSGWTAQDLGFIIRFSAGTAAFLEGETLTGVTSTATATIRRVVVTTGTFSGTAVGFLVISGITGTFQAAETVTSASGSATATAAQEANALPAGGRYNFVNHNFYGSSNLNRMYGVNGVGRGFEWDGTYFAPIRTGLSDALDKPTRIGVLANHLFLTFAGGSISFSEIGEPLQYRTTAGAGEIGFGVEITDLLSSASTALIIYGKTKIGYITGTSSENFVAQDISDRSGALAYTSQNIGQPLHMDDGGVRQLAATDTFGDWRMGSITQQIEPLFNTKRKLSVSPVASLRVRARDLYRLFFSDKTAVSIYMGRKTPECMVLNLPFTATCSCSGEDASDREVLLVGASDGYVYEMDKGTSFDGAEVNAYLRLAFNAIGSPAQNKRWHKATLEIDATSETALSLIAEFGYGNPDLPSGTEDSFTISAGGGFWDTATWDQFFWSAQVVGQAEAYLAGIGQNMSMVVRSDATHEEPHTLSAMTLNFSYRGLRR